MKVSKLTYNPIMPLTFILGIGSNLRQYGKANSQNWIVHIPYKEAGEEEEGGEEGRAEEERGGLRRGGGGVLWFNPNLR